MNYKLTDLSPKWFEEEGERVGITFDCPVDREQKISIRFKGGRVNWAFKGDDFNNLTVSPSINFIVPHICSWHGFIRNGEIINA